MLDVASSTTLISEQEYLSSNEKPYSDYLDGVLRQKSMATRKHSKMEARLSMLINHLEGFEAGPELTLKIRPGKYLVPDVVVQRTSEIQDPYPVRPVHLCIEILSPEDRFGDTVAKCGEYHAWGVLCCWIVDPEEKNAWEYHNGGRPQRISAGGRITAQEIALNVDDLFAGF